MFDPVKPVRTEAREELKSLGGAPSGETHTPRTRTALHGSPLLPSMSTSNTDAPGGRMTRCHAAAAEEDEEEDDDNELCSARKDGVGGIRSNVARERERQKKRERDCSNYNRVRVRESHGVIITNT